MMSGTGGGEPSGSLAAQGAEPTAVNGPAVAVLQQQIQALEAKLDALDGDNYKLREERRTLRAQVRELQGKAPDEGGVVLSAEQATLWQAYQGLGQPDALRQAQEKLLHLERQTAVSQAAKVAGYNEAVLMQLVPATAVLSTVQQTDADGAATTVAMIQTGDGKPVTLSDYAQANWSVFMPALVTETTNNGRAPAAQGTQFIRQTGQTPPPKPKELTIEDIRQRKLERGEYAGI